MAKSNSFQKALDAIWKPTEVGFSPAEPIRPQAPSEPPRRMDYQIGRNLLVSPRAAEGRAVTYSQMRSIADLDSILRTLIEKRKDEMKGLEWDIAVREEFKGQDFPEDIRRAHKFWEKPDLETPFDQWMGALLEDVFVTDAPALFKERDRAGRFRSLQIIDGTSFLVYVDDRGRVPDAPQMAYGQVIKGMTRTSYIKPVQGENEHKYQLYTKMPDDVIGAQMNELYYRPYNMRPQGVYGYSHVESIIMTVNIALRRAQSFLEWFKSGNMPQALKDAPETWTPDQIDKFQAMFDTRLAGDLAARSGIHFVPGGGGTVQQLQQLSFDGVFDGWLARVYCARFGVSPLAYVTVGNKAEAESIEEASTGESLVPMMQYLKNWFDDVTTNCLGLPHLEFIWKQGWQYTSEKQGADIELVKTGGMTLDDILAERGMAPLENGIGSKHMVWAGGVPVLLEDIVNRTLPQQSPGGGGAFGMPGEMPSQGFPGDSGQPGGQPNPFELSIRSIKAELDDWERFALNRLGKKSVRSFTTTAVPATLAAEINDRLATSDVKARTDANYIKSVFEVARQTLTRRRTPAVEGDLVALMADYQKLLEGAMEEAKHAVA